ncbi:hypothetical protein MYX07_07225, partial [Patescibacteria group bacterium AH-259-L07]|nr:hypothetical protein [Patescibacteria group bacterium AH-259-L07]
MAQTNESSVIQFLDELEEKLEIISMHSAKVRWHLRAYGKALDIRDDPEFMEKLPYISFDLNQVFETIKNLRKEYDSVLLNRRLELLYKHFLCYYEIISSEEIVPVTEEIISKSHDLRREKDTTSQRRIAQALKKSFSELVLQQTTLAQELGFFNSYSFGLYVRGFDELFLSQTIEQLERFILDAYLEIEKDRTKVEEKTADLIDSYFPKAKTLS